MADDRDDDEKIGYGRPPKTHRFKPGQSGNPKGRPKGSKNHMTILAQQLNARVLYVENGKRKTMTAHQMMIRQTVLKAAKGDQRAFESLARMAEALQARQDRLEQVRSDELDAGEEAALASVIERLRERPDPDDESGGA